MTFPQHPVLAEADLAGTEPLRPLLRDGRILPGHYVVSGPRELPARFLTALCPTLLRGARVLWLDAGNSFNAYGLGYAARFCGADARAALARVELARPFNLYQLETMVKVKVPERWRGEPVVIADPMPLFYDEDVPEAAARRVLTRVLEGMAALPAVWLVLAVDRPAPAGRESWQRHMISCAQGEMRFYGQDIADDRADAPGGRGSVEAL
ncbi:MAG: hypothetical protein HKL90_05495 [Elusimicrobia bacterium]|nr:hypothetical protein [Elusimicrobiota bacterium]